MQLAFSIHPSHFPASVAVLTYTPEPSADQEAPHVATLARVVFNNDCAIPVRNAVLKEAPVRIRWKPGMEVPEFGMWRQAGCQVTDIGTNSTAFPAFWELYAYKVGNRARVQKKWEALPEADRINAMAAIPRYKRFAANKRIERVYPETYLDQRRWENEF